jgi:hypothetical protein
MEKSLIRSAGYAALVLAVLPSLSSGATRPSSARPSASTTAPAAESQLNLSRFVALVGIRGMIHHSLKTSSDSLPPASVLAETGLGIEFLDGVRVLGMFGKSVALTSSLSYGAGFQFKLAQFSSMSLEGTSDITRYLVKGGGSHRTSSVTLRYGIGAGWRLDSKNKYFLDAHFDVARFEGTWFMAPWAGIGAGF